MTVDVQSRRRLRGVQVRRVRSDAARLLRALGIDAELSIALIGDREMTQLNARYRGKHRPTDVLAFPLGWEAGSPIRSLGDVVISLDTAARQASARRERVDAEVRTLLAHGLLHLLGYDHERSAADARRMFAKQRRLLRLLARP